MVKKYVPDRGDIVMLDFSPQSGREQAGRRPALVVSPKLYNNKVGLALFCPITNQIKGYPFEVELGNDRKTKGVVLADHVKNLDWKSRNARIVDRVPRYKLLKVLDKLNLLIN